jgi:hypothetical protein
MTGHVRWRDIRARWRSGQELTPAEIVKIEDIASGRLRSAPAHMPMTEDEMNEMLHTSRRVDEDHDD